MIAPITLAEIEAARERIRGFAIRTPLVRLNESNFNGEIYLKLENLQPIGCFKVRGAGNAIGKLLAADGSVPENSPMHKGIFTASAGNMAQGVAWQTRGNQTVGGQHCEDQLRCLVAGHFYGNASIDQRALRASRKRSGCDCGQWIDWA